MRRMWFRTRNNTTILYHLTFRDLTLNIVCHNHSSIYVIESIIIICWWNFLGTCALSLKARSSKPNIIIFVSREGNPMDDWFGWWRAYVALNLFTCFELGVCDVIQSNLHDDPAGIHKNNWNSKNEEKWKQAEIFQESKK